MSLTMATSLRRTVALRSTLFFAPLQHTTLALNGGREFMNGAPVRCKSTLANGTASNCIMPNGISHNKSHWTSFGLIRSHGLVGAQRGFSSAAAEIVFDVTQNDFAEKVMQAKVPVIVDIHAEWCNPCKVLAPLITDAVQSHGGRVLLAKLDADVNANLTQQLRVASLPTVFAVFEGKLVDSFTGLLPKEQVDEFVAKIAALGPQENESEIEKAKKLLAQIGDAIEGADETSLTAYITQLESLSTLSSEGEASDNEEVNATALALLVRCYLLQSSTTEAEAVAEQLRTKYPKVQNPVIVQSLATLNLTKRDASSSGSTIQTLVAQLEAEPEKTKQVELRLELGGMYFKESQYEEGIEMLLKVLRMDRGNERAKEMLLEVFDVLGTDSELMKTSRKRMTSLMLV